MFGNFMKHAFKYANRASTVSFASRRLFSSSTVSKASSLAFLGAGTYAGYTTMTAFIKPSNDNDDNNAYNTTTSSKRHVPIQKQSSVFSAVSGDYPVISFIVLANLAVFAAWQVPRLQPFMSKHFYSSYLSATPAKAYTLLTSSFSHQGVWHFAMNMLVFTSLAPACIQLMDNNQSTFLAFYCLVGALSSVGAIAHAKAVYKVTRNMSFLMRKGLGASGSIYGMLLMNIMLMPQSNYTFILFPFYSFTGDQILTGVGCLEFAGLFWLNSPLGHAAHLSGAIVSYILLRLWITNRCHNASRKVKMNNRMGHKTYGLLK